MAERKGRDRRPLVLAIVVLLILAATPFVHITVLVPGRAVAAPGGVAEGVSTSSVAHTRALLGDPDLDGLGRRVGIDFAVTIEPAGLRPGDTVRMTVAITYVFPIVDYRRGEDAVCGDLDFGPGDSFNVRVGGDLPGLAAPLGERQLQLGLYPLAAAARVGVPTGTAQVFVGELLSELPYGTTTSPDGCTQTNTGGYVASVPIPQDAVLAPGGHLATPIAIQFHDIVGSLGAELAPADVDGRIDARLPVVTVLP